MRLVTQEKYSKQPPIWSYRETVKYSYISHRHTSVFKNSFNAILQYVSSLQCFRQFCLLISPLSMYAALFAHSIILDLISRTRHFMKRTNHDAHYYTIFITSCNLYRGRLHVFVSTFSQGPPPQLRSYLIVKKEFSHPRKKRLHSHALFHHIHMTFVYPCIIVQFTKKNSTRYNNV